MLSLAYLLVSSATLAHSFPIFSLYETCHDHDRSSCPGVGRSILMNRVIWIPLYAMHDGEEGKKRTEIKRTKWSLSTWAFLAIMLFRSPAQTWWSMERHSDIGTVKYAQFLEVAHIIGMMHLRKQRYQAKVAVIIQGVEVPD